MAHIERRRTKAGQARYEVRWRVAERRAIQKLPPTQGRRRFPSQGGGRRASRAGNRPQHGQGNSRRLRRSVAREPSGERPPALALDPLRIRAPTRAEHPANTRRPAPAGHHTQSSADLVRQHDGRRRPRPIRQELPIAQRHSQYRGQRRAHRPESLSHKGAGSERRPIGRCRQRRKCSHSSGPSRLGTASCSCSPGSAVFGWAKFSDCAWPMSTRCARPSTSARPRRRYQGSAASVKDPKSDAGRRMVVLPRQAMEAIAAHVEAFGYATTANWSPIQEAAPLAGRASRRHGRKPKLRSEPTRRCTPMTSATTPPLSWPRCPASRPKS